MCRNETNSKYLFFNRITTAVRLRLARLLRIGSKIGIIRIVNNSIFTTFMVLNIAKITMKRYKVSEILKMLRKDGWYLKNQEGSHRQYAHNEKKGKVTYH